MEELTQEELDTLKASKSGEEWNAICDAIKTKHGGYPDDWFQKVIMSGVLVTTSANWKR
jgi:hypothetical protein